MDTSDPQISFDTEGNCNHCTNFLSTRIALLNRDASNQQPLQDLFQQVRLRGRRRKFDCIIGMSGGVDSSYVAVLAAKHGLRVLAVHLDNGWNSPIAVENINRLVKKLNFSYASYVLPWNDFRKVQVAFLRASVPEAETPTDIAIQRALDHYAKKFRIPYILSGGNIASEGILPKSWHYNARDSRYTSAILKSEKCPAKHYKAAQFGLLDEFYAKIIRQVKTAYPLNLIPYNKNAAREELEAEFGWQYYGSKHGESKFTKFIQTYYLVVKHGIDYRRATLSSEICVGSISRKDALISLSAPPFNPALIQDDLMYIAKKLGISTAELEGIVALKPRWYWNFPNNEKMLGIFYDLYRSIAGKRKTSNF